MSGESGIDLDGYLLLADQTLDLSNRIAQRTVGEALSEYLRHSSQAAGVQR